MKEGQDSGAISCQSLNLCTSSHWRSSSPLLRFVSKHKLPEFDKILVPSYPTSFLYSENDSEMSLTEFLSVHFHPCKVKGSTERTTRKWYSTVSASNSDTAPGLFPEKSITDTYSTVELPIIFLT